MTGSVDIYRGDTPTSRLPMRISHAPVSPEDRLDLRGLWSTLRRRFRLALIILLVVVALAVVITLRMTPAYTAISEVALNSTAPQGAPTTATDKSATDPTYAPNDEVADTEVQVLTSREMANRVAEALKLYDNPIYNPLLNTRLGLRGRILNAVGLWKQNTQPIPGTVDTKSIVLDEIQSGLTVTRVGTSFAMTIAFKSRDPLVSASVANEFARQYTLDQLTSQQGENAAAKIFLEKRLVDVRAQANVDTAAAQRYRIDNNLPTTTGASLTEQEISSYNQEVAQARAQAAEDESALATARAQLRSGSAGDDVGAALGSPVIGSLRAKQADLSSQLADLQARYGPRHPDVIKMHSQLADVNSSIAEEIKRTISNLEAKSRASEGRVTSLEGTLGGARSQLNTNNRAMIQLDDLNRRADASQQLYDSYLNRYKEVSAGAGAEHASARILSLAEVPQVPSSPNVVLNIGLAIVIGVGLGLGAALLSELLFSGLTTADDVESRLNLHFLAGVPVASTVVPKAKVPMSAVVEHPRSAFAETFRNLRTSIQYATAGPSQVVAITSALPQEGKTTISTCLARVMAMGGESVVLVDCDVRRRGISRYIGDGGKGQPGLLEVLRGDAALEEALVVDPDTGAYCLLITSSEDDASELITGDRMDALLKDLRARFGTVILDAPPLLPVADARVLASKADTCVLVVRWRKTQDHAVRAALRLLPSEHVRLSGVVLSRVDMRKQTRFGFGDSAFYYKKYEEYYG